MPLKFCWFKCCMVHLVKNLPIQLTSSGSVSSPVAAYSEPCMPAWYTYINLCYNIFFTFTLPCCASFNPCQGVGIFPTDNLGWIIIVNILSNVYFIILSPWCYNASTWIWKVLFPHLIRHFPCIRGRIIGFTNALLGGLIYIVPDSCLRVHLQWELFIGFFFLNRTLPLCIIPKSYWRWSSNSYQWLHII